MQRFDHDESGGYWRGRFREPPPPHRAADLSNARKKMLMKALRYVEIGKPPVVVDIPIPKPGPGQVLLKITAGGVCHSDDYVMRRTTTSRAIRSR